MITPRTSGIIGVHLWGRPCNIEALQSIADQQRLALMFDASHAFTCTHHGMKIGNFGNCEVFSFHATKFFNSFEGGAVVTNDDELAAKIRLMKNFGFSGYDNVIYPGVNGKMTEVCAAMGLTNLESLDYFRSINKRNYDIYKQRLGNIRSFRLLDFDSTEEYNFQYVVLELNSLCSIPRDIIIDILHEEKILARKYFWPGCHKMLPYRAYYPHSGLLLPNTQSIAQRIIVLPTGASVTPNHINIICDILHFVDTHSEVIISRLASAA
jgi:dTDP-4-amino-4,6-dideoxygalactose transaminase